MTFTARDWPCDNPYVTYIIFNMINKLKSYPKQIDNITSDPPPQPEHRDPNIPNRKDIRQHQPQGTEGPRERHTPV
jgi:hypothetical protein